MNDISNEELVMLSREMNEDAIELLGKRINKLISYFLRKYKDMIVALEIDEIDLRSYCVENYLVALNSYCSLNDTKFITYVYLIIERGIKRYISKQQKRKIDLSGKSFDGFFTHGDGVEKEVTINICKERIINYVKYKLKGIDRKIGIMLINGYNCAEISKKLNMNYKVCYQKVKKIRKIFGNQLKILEIDS